jgi:hypothetical protein
MPFSTTIPDIQSAVLPDTKFTIRRMGLGPRTELDRKTLKWRQRKREIESEFEQQPKEQEKRLQLTVAYKKANALKADLSLWQKCIDEDVTPLIREIDALLSKDVKAKRAVLDEEYALLNLDISAAWIRSGLISIDSGEFAGATPDQVIEFAPQEFTAEIYNALQRDGRLAGQEAENFQSPGTSSVAGPSATGTSPTTAPVANAAETTQ